MAASLLKSLSSTADKSSMRGYYSSPNRLIRLANLLVGILLLLGGVTLSGGAVAADCATSPYAGRATLNEFFKDQSNQSNDPDDFAEIKILDTTLTSAVYNNWKIQICEDNEPGNNRDDDGCSGYVSVGSFTDLADLPWLVQKDGTIGRYINFGTGFDAVLVDQNNYVIDYLTLDGYGEAENQLGCTIPSNLPYDTDATSPGSSYKFLSRIPDGIGDWLGTTSGSAPPSEDNTNDKDPNGDPAPTVTVNNVTVNKGDTATFTLTLEGAPKSYAVSIDYATLDATAVAGTDYVYTSGTATIPAGDSSTTVSVNTIAGSTSGVVYFYLYLSNPVNSTIANYYPTGTILAPPSGEWHMDESAWDGTTDEVSDSSGYDNHGTGGPDSWWFGYRGPDTTAAYLCNGGQFDGSNDYVEIPHSSTLNGSDQLTYMAWINPDSWGSGIRQVMAKSVHGGGSGRAQMGIFSENGVLKGRAETAAGRIEVTTSLPATGNWTHVALVFSGTELRLYTNGTLVSSTSFAATTLVQNNDPLMIGKRYGSNQYYFDGYIDEVLLTRNAFPASFISQIYTNYTGGLNWDGSARSCPGQLHHIEIRHDGTALTCNTESIDFRACVDSGCNTLYSGNISVTLSPTGWDGGDSKTITGGSASFDLRHTTAETVTLGISSSSPSADNAPVCVNTAAGNNSCDLTFYNSGFLINVPTQTSCATSGNLTISAVRTDDTTQKCVPAFQSQTKNLKIWASYSNPSSGTEQVTLNHDSTDYLLPTSEPGATNVPVAFNNTADASYTLTYPDAGQLTLNARYDGTGDDAGLVMQGNDTYVTKPAKLYVYSDDTNANCASGDATCSVFTSAGSNFNLKIRGACNDSTSTATPNFQLDNISLSHNLVAPSGGNTGTINVTSVDITAADNGEHVINNQTVSEVGVFTFTAALSGGVNYFGETSIGTAALNTSENIGRFTPHHFNVTATEACNSSFTYSGQPFTVTVDALNNGGNPTRNYRAGFVQDPVISNASDTSNFTNNTLDNTYFTTSDGVGVRNDVTYTFANKETAPLAITRLRATDTDGIDSDGYTEGTVNIRSGRIAFDNAYGSELADLQVPMFAQYYDGSTFVTNTQDSCNTGVTIGLGSATGTVTVGDGNARGETCVQDTGNPGNSGVGCAVAGPVAEQYTDTPSNGDYTLYLKAPDDDTTFDPANPIYGNITVTGNLPGYLQFDWDGDGTEDNPQATATFGRYRGDDRIIYWREKFQ